MAFTLQDIERDVLNRIGESLNTTAASLMDGTTSTPTIATLTSSSAASSLKALINEEAQIFARTCYPIPETGTIAWAASDRVNLLKAFIPTSATTTSGASAKTITAASNASPIVITSTAHGFSNGDFVTVASVGGNTAANGNWTVASVAANTFALVGSTGNSTYTSGGTATLINGNPLWAVRGCKFGSSALVYADLSALERNDRSWMTASTGTPTRYFLEGQNIGLYVTPSASYTTVTINGLAEPKPLVATTDTLPWIPDSLVHILAERVAVKVCLKNLEDPTLYPRIGDLSARADK